MKTLKIALALIAVAGLAGAASAELKDKVELSVQAGLLNIEGDTRIDPALAYGGRAGYFFTERLSVEALLFRSDTETEAGTKVKALYPAVAGSYHFRFGKWMPFAQAGVGLMRINPSGANTDTDLSFHWGGGLKYFWKPNLLLRGDVSHIISAETGNGTHDLLAVAGLSWLFGTPASDDAASKALADARAKAADAARKASDDAMARAAEAARKAADEAKARAAALVDADGDGVIDLKDNCAGTPAGTKVDANGCPVAVDADADGVNDDQDQCAATPAGTKVNASGCPEAAGEIPADEWVLKGVTFQSGSDVLAGSSAQALDEAAAILLPRKSVRIEIQGHTDSTGDAQKNLALSEKRAVTVKNYLVGKGVEAGRLETKGYGSSVPVGDNATAAGRAANRRIEFKVLSR